LEQIGKVADDDMECGDLAKYYLAI